MAANNATLRIEVVSKGIPDTVRKLNMVGAAAANSEVKVKLLTDSLARLMTAQSTAASQAASHAASMSLVAQAMNMIATHATNTSAQVTNLNNQLNSLTLTSNNTTQAFHRKAASGNIVNATIRAMTTAALAYLGINFAKGIVEAADGWKMMQARLKLATGTMEEAKIVQEDLFKMSQRIRTPLEDSLKLYTRMAIPMQRLGKDARETANQVEFVALALKLNGATAGEAASVMLQYSQSVNAGRLNGAEFNAVAEGAPLILRAIEAELKATTGWNERTSKSLKQMGADGEISFELMNRAAQRALPAMRKDFEQLPLTVDGAIQRVKNAWFKAMGEMGESTGMGDKLAKAIGQLEKDIPKIRDALAETFLFLHDNFSTIATVVKAILIGAFIQKIATLTLAIPALVTALAAAAGGLTAAATAMAVMRAGLVALSGPIGIAVALVGTGLVAAYQHFSREVPKAEEVVTEAATSGARERIEWLQREIGKMEERNRLAAKPVTVASAQGSSPGAREIFDQAMKVHKLQQKSGNSGADARLYMAEFALLEQMTREQKKFNELRAAGDSAMQAEKAEAWKSKFLKQTETDLERFNRVVAEEKKKAEELGIVWTKEYEDRIRRDTLKSSMTEKVDHFGKLKSGIMATSDALKEYLEVGEKATASEKLKFKFQNGADESFNSLTPSQKSRIMSDVENNIAAEARIEIMKREKLEQEKLNQEHNRYINSLGAKNLAVDDEIIRMQARIASLTMSKTAVRELAAAEYERESQKAIDTASMVDPSKDAAAYNLLVARAEKYQELADLQRKLGKGQDEKEAYEILDKLLDPEKALDFGEALGDAFGKAGDAIAKMSKSLGSYGKVQDKINDEREKLMSLAPDEKRAKGLAKLDKEESKNKLRAYGDMASGMKDLMSEHTAGYKIMAATEKAFRLAEMAMTIEATATKVWGSLTTATAKGVETAANVTGAAVDTATTGTSIANSFARAGASVMAGAAKMFEQSGWLGFAGVAAMVALMAGLGFGGGGTSAVPVDYKDRQAKQHSGTVLGGDEETKSESISNSIDALADNSNIGLILSTQMLSSLRGIEASMNGLATSIFKVNGMTTGKNLGIVEGTSGSSGFLGNIISGIFGGKTTTTITDSGMVLKGTAEDFLSGGGTQQYVDTHTKKSGGLFGGSKSWNDRQLADTSKEIAQTIGRIFADINSTIVDAAEYLGGNGEAIKMAVESYMIDTEISLMNLKGDELKQALEDMFSAVADTAARSVFNSFEAFQRVNEGYYETIIRVAADSEKASNALETFGISIVNVHDLANKTGDIAANLVRESILAVEAGGAIANIMRVMDGGMQDLIEGYKALLSIQDTMRAASLGAEVSIDTIRGAGGLLEAESALNGFIDAFYTEAEKQAVSVYKLQAEFNRLNVAMPETMEGFRALVSGLMAGSEQSRELAGRVLLLSESFADASQAAVDIAADFAQKISERMTAAFDAMESAGNMLDRIDSAFGGPGKAYALLREQRLWASLAEADYKQQIALAEQLMDSVLGRHELEKSNAEKLISFAQSLRTYVDGLKIGNLSPLTTAEKLSEAAKQYANVLNKAKEGDETAMGALQGVSSSYLDLARQYFASSEDYSKIFNNVTGALDALGMSAQSEARMQLEVSSQSLEELRRLQGVIENAYDRVEAEFQDEKTLLQQQVNGLLRTATGIEAVRDLLAGMPAELATQIDGGASDFSELANRYVSIVGGATGYTLDPRYVASVMEGMDRATLQKERAHAMSEIADPAVQAQVDAIFRQVARMNGIDGSHASGLSYVPFDGYIAELHKGERVVTAEDNREYMSRQPVYSKDESVAEMAAEIRSLNTKIDALTKQNEQLMLAQIRATVESSENNAKTIVQSVDKTSERAAHAAAINPKGYN